MNEDEDVVYSPLKFTGGKPGSGHYSSIGGDLPLEIMIMAKKFEDLGLLFEYDQSQCIVRVKDPRDPVFSYSYTWHRESNEKDLNVFFADVRAAFKAHSGRPGRDEYVYL